MFDYAVHELRYSETAAYRRIEAMRALETNPEIEEKIEAGTLKLCVVAQAQKFFRHEAKAGVAVDRAEVFETLANKSTREAERELLARSHSPATLLNAERITAKTEELIEIRFMVEREFEADLAKLRGLLAHRDPHMGIKDLMKEMMRRTLAALDPAREPKRKAKVEKEEEPLPTPETKTEKGERYIPAKTKREVWRRAQGQCEYAGCTSCFGLEIDHIVALAKGGINELSNLRLLCFQHNQYEAERVFGREFMHTARVHAQG